MKTHIRKSKSGGFTIVEITIAIALLCILGAVGLSSFTTYNKEARKALVLGTAAAYGTAISQAAAQWTVLGSPSTINLKSTTIDVELNENGVGYPHTDDGVLDDMLGYTETDSTNAIVDKCTNLYNLLMFEPMNTLLWGAKLVDSHNCEYAPKTGKGPFDADKCGFIYYDGDTNVDPQFKGSVIVYLDDCLDP